VVFGLIRDHPRQAQGDDVLSLLLAARADTAAGSADRMSERQVRDEAMTLFLAGHETTANALSWSLYLLSQHPDAAARLYAEAADAWAGIPFEAGDIARSPLARAVFAEALRLYPPSWALGRRAIEDVIIDGYRIPAGSSVLLSPWVIQHDPRWFPDPFRFDVDRWRSEAVAARPRHAFFPFGAGPRQCIGEEFAWAEGAIALTAVARRWRLSLSPGQRIVLQPRITLRPKGPLRMRIQAMDARRSSKPAP
jgi:cytochrome P450